MVIENGELRILHDDHGAQQPVGLDGAQRCVMPVEALQRRGIGIDNSQGSGLVALLGSLPCLPHVALTAALGLGILSVAGHHHVRTGHFILALRHGDSKRCVKSDKY